MVKTLIPTWSINQKLDRRRTIYTLEGGVNAATLKISWKRHVEGLAKSDTSQKGARKLGLHASSVGRFVLPVARHSWRGSFGLAPHLCCPATFSGINVHCGAIILPSMARQI